MNSIIVIIMLVGVCLGAITQRTTIPRNYPIYKADVHPTHLLISQVQGYYHKIIFYPFLGSQFQIERTDTQFYGISHPDNTASSWNVFLYREGTMEYKWRKDGDTAMTSSFVALEIGCIVLGNSTLDTFIVQKTGASELIRYFYNQVSYQVITIAGLGLQIQYYDERVYLLQQDIKYFINIYDMNLTLLHQLEHTITYSNSQIDINNNLLGFMQGNNAIFYNLSSGTPAILLELSLNQTISDFTILNQYIIFYCQDNYLYQYDISLNTFISSLYQPNPNISTDATLQRINNQQVIMWFTYESQFITFHVDENIVCIGGCLSCPASYVLNSQGQCEIPQQQSPYPNIVAIIQISGNFLIIASWKVSTKFLIPFVCLLQDFWYYKFHHTQYPQFMKYFMGNIDLLNVLRLKPQFLDTDQYDINVGDDQKNNEKYLSTQQNYVKGPDEVYFLHSTKEIYIWNLALNISIFLGLYLMRLILKRIKEKYKVRFLTIFYRELKLRTKWWVLMIMIVQSNFLRLIFNISTQLKYPFSFDFSNKINLSIAIFMGFFMLIFAIGFYPLMYKFVKKKFSQTLLSCSHFYISSFYFEMLLIMWRNLFRGFIHAYFLNQYQIQLLCLIGTDFLLMMVIWVFKKRMLNMPTKLSYLLYALAFLLFDIVLFLRLKNVQLPVSYDQLISVFIFILIGLTVIKMFLALFESIKQICQFCKINKVQPVNQNKKSPIKKEKHQRAHNKNKQEHKDKISKLEAAQRIIRSKQNKKDEVQIEDVVQNSSQNSERNQSFRKKETRKNQVFFFENGVDDYLNKNHKKQESNKQKEGDEDKNQKDEQQIENFPKPSVLNFRIPKSNKKKKTKAKENSHSKEKKQKTSNLNNKTLNS